MSSNCVLGSGSTMPIVLLPGPSLGRAKRNRVKLNIVEYSILSLPSCSSDIFRTKFSYPVSKMGMSPGAPVSGPLRLQEGPLRSRFALISSCLRPEKGGFGPKPFRIGEKDGLMIVDHGSRRRESNLMLNEFVAMFRDKTGYTVVEPAHMELADPSIKDAFSSCVQQGVTRVIVSPFFLFPGRHWHKDIPSLTAEAAKEHPGVSYIITAPLGLHELLVDVVNDRIKHCLSHVEGDAGECEVCAGTGKCRIY